MKVEGDLIEKCRPLSCANIEQTPALKINVMTHGKPNECTVHSAIINLLSASKGHAAVNLSTNFSEGDVSNVGILKTSILLKTAKDQALQLCY